jgi:ABC-type phosphate transport system substrate-binding protein
MIGKLLCCLMLVLLTAAATAGELVVVVSAHSPLTALRAEQVADIFLSEATRFPDGSEVVALDLPIGSPLRDDFYLKVANRTPALMKAYWTKKIFTGRGQPPRELPNSLAVRKQVAEDPTLIGYIERSALDASVRPVLVVH